MLGGLASAWQQVFEPSGGAKPALSTRTSSALSQLHVGELAWHRVAKQVCEVVEVHYDDIPPYYTVRMSSDGMERATVRSRLVTLEDYDAYAEAAGTKAEGVADGLIALQTATRERDGHHDGHLTAPPELSSRRSSQLSPLQLGDMCWHRVAKVVCHVVEIHYDDVPPYYTVKMPTDGSERATVRSRLETLEECETAAANASSEDDRYVAALKAFADAEKMPQSSAPPTVAPAASSAAETSAARPATAADLHHRRNRHRHLRRRRRRRRRRRQSRSRTRRTTHTIPTRCHHHHPLFLPLRHHGPSRRGRRSKGASLVPFNEVTPHRRWRPASR